MRLRFFGGFAIEASGGDVVVRGRGQEALLYRLSLDTGSAVRYRVLAEDVWGADQPEDPRAALQSLVSRMRRTLPPGVLEAVPGGYRLTLTRDAIDLTAFQDLVAQARRSPEPQAAAALARSALVLWTGEPWTPSDAFDWVVSDLYEDRGHAERLIRAAEASLLPVAALPQTAAFVTGKPPTPATGVTTVPAAITALVGRRDELDLIAGQLTTSRLVTLIGPGGAGKTTLALETARRYPGAIVVELAPAAPEEVWPAVAAAVGRTFRLTDGPAAHSGSRERAVEALAGRSVLVVLDNCEHVTAEAAAVSRDLLQGVPTSTLLATSREPLGLPGEAFVNLGPLPGEDAVELFARRVRAARGRVPDPSDEAGVARIVERLDGLPLALELAAAKARTMSIAEIDAGLDDRFTLLANGPRAADPRHQTLRALIDWSWETLTEPERAALLAAAVFPDGIGAEDGVVVARTTGTSASAFDLLVDRSLLHRSAGRFRMLETVREYGLDRLRADHRLEDLRARQVRTVVELAEPMDALLRGPQVRRGLAWFDANEENLSAAVRGAQADPELHDLGVRLVRAALWAWVARERFEDLQTGLAAFSSPSGALDSEPAVVVNGVGLLVAMFSATRPRSAQAAPDVTARPEAERTVPPHESAPDIPVEQLVARARAIDNAARQHPSEATAVIAPLVQAAAAGLDPARLGGPWSQSFRLAEDAGRDAPLWARAFLELVRAAAAQNNGDIEALGLHSEAALALFREAGDVWGVASASQMRSEWLMLQGRLEEALADADEATEQLVGLSSLADVLQQRAVGVVALTRLGRIDEARVRAADILAIAQADGAERTLQFAHLIAAGLEVALGNGAAALEQLDAVPADSSTNAFTQFTAWSGAVRAKALLLCGRIDEARGALRQAIPIAVSSGDQPIMAEAALALAVLLETSGDVPGARRALATSVALRGGLDATDPSLARLVAVLGQPDAQEGEADLMALLDLLE